MKKWNIVGMAAAVGIAAITFHAYAADKLKVGFIYVGPIGDLGWSYQHDLGRKEMEKALGDKVESTYLENVPEGADAERSIEQLARTGHKLIFTTSFGFMDATLKVANKYPNVFFEHATGFKRAKNMSTYAARFYEGRYIQGQIAGKMSKSGIVGYIVSFPIPEVISNINATMLGAQSVNPNIKFKIVWVNSWFRSGQGGRRRQGAGRPGRRHPHPAHRLAGGNPDRHRVGHGSAPFCDVFDAAFVCASPTVC